MTRGRGSASLSKSNKSTGVAPRENTLKLTPPGTIVAPRGELLPVVVMAACVETTLMISMRPQAPLRNAGLADWNLLSNLEAIQKAGWKTSFPCYANANSLQRDRERPCEPRFPYSANPATGLQPVQPQRTTPGPSTPAQPQHSRYGTVLGISTHSFVGHPAILQTSRDL